jgi:hypothetical protein
MTLTERICRDANAIAHFRFGGRVNELYRLLVLSYTADSTADTQQSSNEIGTQIHAPPAHLTAFATFVHKRAIRNCLP